MDFVRLRCRSPFQDTGFWTGRLGTVLRLFGSDTDVVDSRPCFLSTAEWGSFPFGIVLLLLKAFKTSSFKLFVFVSGLENRGSSSSASLSDTARVALRDRRLS